MANQYCEVINGTITKYNIKHGKPYGNVSFGKNSTDDEYRAVGLYPIVGSQPQYDRAIQNISSPTYEVDEATKTINKVYVVSGKPLDDVKAKKLEELAAKAFEVEIQGVTVGSDEIGTDRESVGRVTGALSLMGRNPTATTDFKTKGGWAVANKAALEAIQDAIWSHVKGVAANEKSHYDAINALTTAQEVVDYDISAGW